jgi:hypothetical protein
MVALLLAADAAAVDALNADASGWPSPPPPCAHPTRPLPIFPTCARSDLLAAVREEVAQVVRIFAQPKLALELFLQRIFEQKVQGVLERLLQLPSPKAPAAQQQNYLQ